MSSKWMLDLASRERVDRWSGEAKRLRATLDAVSECVNVAYGAPLIWRDENLSAEQWSSLDEIAVELERQRLRDDEGSIIDSGPASSSVQGYLNDAPAFMANALWSVGRDGEWPFICNIDFLTRTPEQGHARLLHEHPVEWLARLVSAAAQPSGASRARIHTPDLLDLLGDVDEAHVVGALTLAPHGIDTAALPASVTAYPCPVGYPEGVVLVADLDRIATEPESLVGDLLTVDVLLRQGADSAG